MVNGGRVVEIRVAVGGADGHQVADVVVYTEDRQDALGGEAVDGGDQLCGRQPRISERQKIEVVMQDIEGATRGLLERARDMQTFVDLGVQQWVFGVTLRGDGLSRARVTESAVANSVTSTPRATRPSVSIHTTRSQGP